MKRITICLVNTETILIAVAQSLTLQPTTTNYRDCQAATEWTSQATKFEIFLLREFWARGYCGLMKVSSEVQLRPKVRS